MQVLKRTKSNERSSKKPSNKNNSTGVSKRAKDAGSIITKIKTFLKLTFYLILTAGIFYTGWFFYSGKASQRFLYVKGNVINSINNYTVTNGLVLKGIDIKGTKYTDDVDIYNAIRVSSGTPILAVDPYIVREELKKLPWIRDVMVVRKMPDELIVKIVEYVPFALWLDDGGKSRVVTSSGYTIIDSQSISESLYNKFMTTLPIIKGKGGNVQAKEIVTEVEKFKTLNKMITAYEFVDERRWNLVFDKVVVKLPEIGLADAIKELNIINKKRNIKNMRVKIIDMRNSEKIMFYLERGASLKLFEKIKRGKSV